MCIIVYKPAGVDMPNYDILNNCFENNPDGCGLMYQAPEEDKVIINKGFMHFADLLSAIAHIERQINIIDVDVVLHFRLATQGGVNAGNCHPFPISKKVDDLKATDIGTRVGIAHNGIISFCSERGVKAGYPTPTLSDTQIFVKDYLGAMSTYALFNKAMGKIVKQATNSKFAVMSDTKTILIGDFIEDGGIYYSNTSYKASRWEWSKPIARYSQNTISLVDNTNNKNSPYLCDICGTVQDDVVDIEGVRFCMQCLEGCYDDEDLMEDILSSYTCECCGKTTKNLHLLDGLLICSDCYDEYWNNEQEGNFNYDYAPADYACVVCGKRGMSETYLDKDGYRYCKKCYDAEFGLRIK